MSQEIICRDCHTRNTLGSKFCNNCGARLPATTKIICPNCETPNPRNRFYCDNCGTRLVQDELPQEEPESKDPPTEADKIFSLPIRPPGDTGELDAKQSIPDWLKGQTDSTPGEEASDDAPRRNMPKIEDVGDAKKMTDDLPDWLIDEHESNPILGSPRIITTEHYLNLIDEAEDSVPEELEELAESAELPDWLNDLATPTVGETATTSDDQSTTDDALAEWLTSIAQSDDSADSAFDDIPTSVAPSADDLERKLDELSQSDSGLLESFDSAADDVEETADWLSAMRSPDTDSLAEPDHEELTEVEESATEIEEEMFDWLADSLADTGLLAGPPTDAGPQEANDAIPEETSDWLADDDFSATSDDALADLADAVAQQDIGSPEDALPDWPAGEEADPLANVASGETQPDWMAEFTASVTGQLEQPSEPDIEIEEPVDLPELAPSEPPSTGPLPDWLADFDENDSLIAADAGDDTILSELLASDAADDRAGLDWLAAERADEDEEETAVAPDDAPPSLIEGDTDWLTELVTLGDDAFAAEEAEPTPPPPEPATEMQPESETDLFATDWPTEMTAQADDGEDGEEAFEVRSADQDSEWLHADSMLTDALEEEMPDWLDELGAPQSDSLPPEPDDSPEASDSLPDWIAQMKPGTIQTGSQLSDSSDLASLSGSLLDMPNDLASNELPGWLQDAAGAADEMLPAALSLEESADIPNWLKSDGGLGSEDGLDSGATSEWTTILQDLPPASAAQDRLAKAELPDWIKELKPPELTGEKAPEPEKPIHEVGPLSGIRGVIDIEPIIAQPRDYSARPSFTITPNQQTQAALLKQLSLAEQAAAEPVADVKSVTSVWTRLVLAVLLLAAILMGLLRPNALPPAEPPARLPVEMAYEAVQSAAQQPVLLAVEFTPAMAGELDVQAEMLAAQLLANGSQVVTVSQYAAGTAVAQTLTPNQPSLGLIPGESIGLRQLGDCLPNCAALSGTSLSKEMQQTLADVSLIIVLTGERDSLVNWLEQVGSRHDIPILAGVTQSLGPVAAPYFDSGQLQGVIAGMPDTAVYQQLHLLNPSDRVSDLLSAQTLAQLLAAAALLVGGLGYIMVGLFKRGKSNQV